MICAYRFNSLTTVVILYHVEKLSTVKIALLFKKSGDIRGIKYAVKFLYTQDFYQSSPLKLKWAVCGHGL